MKKTAVIGLGTIGGMIAEKIVENGVVRPEEVNIFNRTVQKAEDLAAKHPGYNVCTDPKDAVSDAECIFVCLQAKHIPEMLLNIRESIPEDSCLYISTASIAFADMALILPGKFGKFIPTMMCSANRSVAWSCFNEKVTDSDKELFNSLIGSMTVKLYEINEDEFKILDYTSGLMPAYLAYFCQTIADRVSKVQDRFPYEELSAIVTESLEATGIWLNETGRNIESVVSTCGHPGGVTYESLSALTETLPDSIDELIKRGIEARDAQTEGVSQQIRQLLESRS